MKYLVGSILAAIAVLGYAIHCLSSSSAQTLTTADRLGPAIATLSPGLPLIVIVPWLIIAGVIVWARN